jgi:hypothetical protein
VDGRDGAPIDQRADLVGMRAVTDEVAAAVDPLDAELLDAGEDQVRVHVRDDRDPVGHAHRVVRSIDKCK